MDAAVKLIVAAVPWITPTAHAVVSQLAARRGFTGPAHAFALSVGLRNRFQLNRLLQRESLPSLEELAAWIKILVLVLRWEVSRTALSDAALSDARDPGPLYRTVWRMTGLRWSEVRSRGSLWVVLQLSERCTTIRSRQPSRSKPMRASGESQASRQGGRIVAEADRLVLIRSEGTRASK